MESLSTQFINKFSYRGILAIIITLGSFSFLFALLFIPIPKGNEAAVNVAQGFVLGVLGTTAAWYFGSSKSKEDSDKAAHVAEIIRTEATFTKTENSGNV